jgi:hypothetical protein
MSLTTKDVKALPGDHLESGAQELDSRREKDGHVPGGHITQTSEETKANRSLNRKLDIWLLPFLSLLYLFSGLDRGNVGFAETQGFTKDIGAKPNDLNDAVSLFFVTFVTLQPISAAAGRWMGAKNWVPIIMVSSGEPLLAACRGRG